jgi:hypothetical protein
VAPIHAEITQRPIVTERREVSAGAAKKGGEFGAVHLTAGHRERAMMDCAEPAGMAIDFDVVRRVGEYGGGAFLAHQRSEGVILQRIAAQHAMLTEPPQDTELGDRRAATGF